MAKKLKLLFLCTGNSCRSQMAEGWANSLKSDVLTASSAGIEKHGMNPYAVRVMAEKGVDLGNHRSQLLEEFTLSDFDYIVTVCDHAAESCPVVPADCRVVHRSFADPPRLARSCTTEEEVLDCYRKVRDEIRNYIETLPESLAERSDRL